MRAVPPEKERGNATAEFVMVSALVVLLFLGVLQVAFALFTRNVLQDAASQGARYGAMLDKTPADGEERTRELLYSVLPSHYSATISSSVTQWQGADAVQVTVVAPVPLIGPFGVAAQWEVSGHAVVQR
ncbi:TadE/TadG family type IV pilus assembly protein [Rothia sp. SD9660Na]|uniref:TadE/TadG family type IV pilus assembly protein n=1 Tax=Rothia sp. SD9660Na TaxID=3047030 RepID=UPI0024BB6D0F|nr:TadE/TadG family type IV pilus assembly protein [Rothia sp. SD9660Na]WHS49711.1 TadE/TadG family type IV pilus assembly protein [Rothia sp. SD9660Na]